MQTYSFTDIQRRKATDDFHRFQADGNDTLKQLQRIVGAHRRSVPGIRDTTVSLVGTSYGSFSFISAQSCPSDSHPLKPFRVAKRAVTGVWQESPPSRTFKDPLRLPESCRSFHFLCAAALGHTGLPGFRNVLRKADVPRSACVSIGPPGRLGYRPSHVRGPRWVDRLQAS